MMRCAAFRVLRSTEVIVRPWRKWILTFGLMALLCFALSCGGDLGPTGGNRAQFLVTLTSISPSTVTAGGPAFTLTVTGSNITAGVATLVWNGGQQLSSVQGGSNGSATFQIDASMIANPGNISIAVVDGINNNQLSNALTLTVSPLGQTTCALFGTYNFLFTGSDGKATVGALGVDANGNVTGEYDLSGVVGGTPFSQSGTCKNSSTPNEGTLNLASGTYTFVLQQSGAGWLSGPGSGLFLKAAATGALANGDYIIGLLGEDPYGDSGVGAQIGTAGRFTYSSGNLSAGLGDVNDGGTVIANPSLSGSQAPSQPDVWPRMLLNLSVGGQSAGLAVYVNSSGGAFTAGFIATPFPHISGLGVANVAGFISPQVNAGMYDNTSLNGLVFSTWGAQPPLCCPTINPSQTDTTIGLASGFNSNAGTFNLLFDNVSGGLANLSQSVTGAAYNVVSSGRATISYSVGGKTVNYVYYLDNVNDGFILGLSSNTAEFGLFQPQAAGPFSASTISGSFAAGTFLSLTPASPNLATEITLSNGSISASTPSGALSGTYTVAASGRGMATVDLPALGGNDLVFYVIGPNSLVLMGSDNTTTDAITFMHF